MVHNGRVLCADVYVKFSFHSTKDQLIELELTSVGYQPEHYVYPFTLQYSSIVDITVQMKTAPKEIEGVVVSTQGSFTMGLLISRVRIKKESLLIPVEPSKPNELLVFPNPVESGNTINISFKQMD